MHTATPPRSPRPAKQRRHRSALINTEEETPPPELQPEVPTNTVSASDSTSDLVVEDVEPMHTPAPIVEPSPLLVETPPPPQGSLRRVYQSIPSKECKLSIFSSINLRLEHEQDTDDDVVTDSDKARIRQLIEESDEAAKDGAYDEAWSETIDYLTKYKIIDDSNAKYYRRVFEGHDTDKRNMLNEDQVREVLHGFHRLKSHCGNPVSISNQGRPAQKPPHTGAVQLHHDAARSRHARSRHHQGLLDDAWHASLSLTSTPNSCRLTT